MSVFRHHRTLTPQISLPYIIIGFILVSNNGNSNRLVKYSYRLQRYLIFDAICGALKDTFSTRLPQQSLDEINIPRWQYYVTVSNCSCL